ncbi:hypothetical protein BJV77DRAFT_989462 [Russula vinacea]|nr:hypothetical protein BJV77DRAFT_989462 [Russula vinacea]
MYSMCIRICVFFIRFSSAFGFSHHALMVLPGRFRQCHCYVPPVPERGPDSDRASLLQFVLPVLTVLKSRRINDDLVLRRLPGISIVIFLQFMP